MKNPMSAAAVSVNDRSLSQVMYRKRTHTIIRSSKVLMKHSCYIVYIYISYINKLWWSYYIESYRNTDWWLNMCICHFPIKPDWQVSKYAKFIQVSKENIIKNGMLFLSTEIFLRSMNKLNYQWNEIKKKKKNITKQQKLNCLNIIYTLISSYRR